MKVVLKIVGVLVLLVLLGMGGAVGYFYGALPHKRAPQDVHAPNTPEAIARGEYLFNHVTACVGCHSQVNENEPGAPVVPGTIGGGRDFGAVAVFPGRVISPNITPDPEHGIGKWTDGEIMRAMREGVDKDGKVLFPMMPYQNFGKRLSDADALAIVAYLRTLPPLSSNFGKTKIDFPVAMFMRGAPAPVTSPAGAPPTD